jgi:hypothetical protein
LVRTVNETPLGAGLIINRDAGTSSWRSLKVQGNSKDIATSTVSNIIYKFSTPDVMGEIA